MLRTVPFEGNVHRQGYLNIQGVAWLCVSGLILCKSYLSSFQSEKSHEYESYLRLLQAFWTYKIQGDFNLLNPTGYVTHQQFNIQQLYALPTLYLCVLYLSEKKQRIVPLAA